MWGRWWGMAQESLAVALPTEHVISRQDRIHSGREKAESSVYPGVVSLEEVIWSKRHLIDWGWSREHRQGVAYTTLSPWALTHVAGGR